METTERTKFCKHCGAKKIPEDAVLCTACGRQVEKLENESAPNIVIDNLKFITKCEHKYQCSIRASLQESCATNGWLIALCFFGGFFGLHKFYEGEESGSEFFIFSPADYSS